MIEPKLEKKFQSRTKVLLLFLFFQLIGMTLFAQDNPSLLFSKKDTLNSGLDTLDKAKINPFGTNNNRKNVQTINISKDSLDAPVDYSARDSMRIDVENKKIFLFGEGDISYTSINLKADFIEFDWENNVVTARGAQDSLGRWIGKPIFTDGKETFDAGEIRYNFKTQKGLITEAASVQQNLFVRGKRTKYVSALGDTTKSDIIYNKNAIFTSCDLEHPHFGIRSTKQKVIPGKLVVIGPSNVEIGNIPTPLWLPFGFFPINVGASSGLIFPQGYEYDPRWGFGLEGVGWYFPINDYLHFKATGDIFVKGTYRLKGRADYRRRYKYNGYLDLQYANYNNENDEAIRVRDRAFSFNWRHNQDAKANPYRSFGGNIDFQTNNALSKATNNVFDVEKTTISSGLNYVEKFPNKPINLSIGLNHSQNLQTRKVTLNAPTVSFQLSRIYPFKRKNPVGKSQWYEDIALDYRGESKSRIVGTDTTFLEQETWRNAQYGAKHKANLSTKFRLFKYFNVTPRATYEETWFFKELNKTFDTSIDTTITIVNGLQQIDTIQKSVMDTLISSFTPFRKFSSTVQLNTKLFGKILFKKGPIRGIRHIMTPSVSFSYQPEQDQYWREVRDSSTDPDSYEEYHIFSNGLYSASPQKVKQMALVYSIGNSIETKVFSKRDSTTRNVPVIRSLNINGNYNFAADTLNWSTVGANTNVSLFNGITALRLSATFDPYKETEAGKRINTYYWKENKKPLRFEQFRATLTNKLTVKKITQLLTGERDKDPNAPELDDLLDENDEFREDPFKDKPLLSPEEEERLKEKKKLEEQRKRERFASKQSLISLFDNFGIDHTLRLQVDREKGKDTVKVTAHSIALSGSIQLTERWSFTGLRLGYDFTRKRITYPQIGIKRDLHCWELGGFWQPQRGTFQFYLRVKPGSTLDFLKVPYNKTVPPSSVFD